MKSFINEISYEVAASGNPDLREVDGPREEGKKSGRKDVTVLPETSTSQASYRRMDHYS